MEPVTIGLIVAVVVLFVVGVAAVAVSCYIGVQIVGAYARAR